MFPTEWDFSKEKDVIMSEEDTIGKETAIQIDL
jgi:hypothetical protein